MEIMQSVAIRKWVTYSVLWLGLGLWISFFVFQAYCHDGHLPNAPQQSTGHIYQSNNHGHMAYLAKSEHNLLIGLEIGGVAFFVLAFILNRTWRVHVHPLEGLTPQQRYNVLQGRPMNKNYDD
jgi:hypothetical protein